jgi:regulator of replication initiation timing
MYQKFDKLRNGISASSSKIQKQFESYLSEAEELIIEVRNLSESLAETGVELDSVNESKIGDIIKIIKKEIVNFKKWITKKIKTMNKLYTILKEDIEMIEKEIQKEFNIK